MIKGYADRARTLCDPQYLNEELLNIEEVFLSNGYTRNEVREAMKERTTRTDDKKEEDSIRGIVSIPNTSSSQHQKQSTKLKIYLQKQKPH